MKISGSFDLPIYIKEDREYFNTLQNEFKRYRLNLKNCEVPPKVIKKVKRNSDRIVLALQKYYSSDILEAQKTIASILEDYKDNKFFFSPLNSSYAFRNFLPFINARNGLYQSLKDSDQSIDLSFFKARVGRESESFGFKDMLHIPFDKRELVQTQRFSLPGIPCLYFSVSSYGCWLELGQPSSECFYAASYKIDPSYRILNLTSSWNLISNLAFNPINHHAYDIDVESLIYSLIEIWPLVCATSFKVAQSNRHFKSEYIVSQLIMMSIPQFSIDGIAYYSTRVSARTHWKKATVNLALPAPYTYNSVYKDNLSSDILRRIQMSPVVNLGEVEKLQNAKPKNLNRSYLNQICGFPQLQTINFAGRNIPYDKTEFSLFDDYLVALPHEFLHDWEKYSFF